jgi:uncharacterized membrane protein YgcG
MRLPKLSISIALLITVLMPASAFASTENFYFENFDADYYVTKDSNGVSKMKVVENFTTVFPDYNQNKGICRMIPFTNQDGANITLDSLTRNDITVKRNGNPEPIYSITKDSNYYEVCTGNDDYVLGTQVYTFEYEFKRVVTDFVDYQEIYWDTNGTGWFQKFNKVTARVHFVDADVAKAFDGGKWCYVGKYNVSGSERCEISEISDGLQFSTGKLDRFENVTFDIEFNPGTFVVPGPIYNLMIIWLMIVVIVICIIIIVLAIIKHFKLSEKRKYYKNNFVKPEYQPHEKLDISELTEMYIGKKQDSKIGVMLDMLVKKQIRLIKEDDKKKKWKIEIVKFDAINEEGKILLQILNNGSAVEQGDVINIKQNAPSSSLQKLGEKYKNIVISKLKQHQLSDKGYIYGLNTNVSIIATAIASLVMGFMTFAITLTAIEAIRDDLSVVGILVGEDYVPYVNAIVVGVSMFIQLIIRSVNKKYEVRTKEGLEAARFMDGLRLYISMAEADRLKFLQSVNGVDISNNGIVNLYEKLLPYAAIFGLEKSWMKELEKYYKIEDVKEPEWYRSGLSSSDMFVLMSRSTRYATNATHYSNSYSSGGGGFSSGFSGGGGGGFSGGGGGGGGGHGR